MNIEKLYEHYKKNYKISTDTRKIEKDSIFFALKGPYFNGNHFALQALENGASIAIVDEEKYVTSPQIILVENALKTLQTLASYHRKKLSIPIIALTGSNGKTTTKELLLQVLSKKFRTRATQGNLNNHIGVPLTLLSLLPTDEIAVIEMGANHQKEIEHLCKITKPDYAYITNFGQAHLEGFGGIEGVIKGKTELYDYCLKTNKMAFVNEQDTIQMEKSEEIQRYIFGKKKADTLVQITAGESPFITVLFHGTEIKSYLIGDYNFSNIACAIAVGEYFKISITSIREAIESYIPKNNRSQLITKKDKKILLDAYNANPTSMRAVITHFSKEPEKKTVILGDMLELGEYEAKAHQEIVDLALSCHFKHLILVGEAFYQTKGVAIRFLSTDELKLFLNENQLSKHILIKGSRDIKLEAIIDNL